MANIPSEKIQGELITPDPKRFIAMPPLLKIILYCDIVGSIEHSVLEFYFFLKKNKEDTILTFDAQAPQHDLRAYRHALGRFATGVCIVTYMAENEPSGITVNSFTSISLDPPLILIAIDKQARAAQYLDGAPVNVHILDSAQEQVSRFFAGQATTLEKAPWSVQANGLPRLDEALAVFECQPYQTIEAGDHFIYLLQVERFTYRDGGALGYFHGRYITIPEPNKH